jgi:hypothetical protein
MKKKKNQGCRDGRTRIRHFFKDEPPSFPTARQVTLKSRINVSLNKCWIRIQHSYESGSRVLMTKNLRKNTAETFVSLFMIKK